MNKIKFTYLGIYKYTLQLFTYFTQLTCKAKKEVVDYETSIGHQTYLLIAVENTYWVKSVNKLMALPYWCHVF
jgi:hypothetical protein